MRPARGFAGLQMSRSMRAPSFWNMPHSAPSLAPRLLAPFGALYAEIAGWRMSRRGRRLPIPVLCVGNFVVGGAGKTPAAVAVAKRLIESGETPFFLSRGYHSAAEHRPPLRVDLARHRAGEVGDEALLLARVAPTVVSADRVAAGRLARSQGASVLILDDGLQNPALEKNLRFAIVDGATGIGNGLCLPAGPLRATLAAQIEFVNAVVIVGAGDPGARVAEQVRAAGKPVVSAELVVDAATAAKLAKQRVHAFAGLGRPDKFFASLADLGAEIVGVAGFPDHHAYRRAEILSLQHAAQRENALLVTTEKDLVKLAGRADLVNPWLPVPLPVPVEMKFSDAGVLEALVANAMRGTTSPSLKIE
jgi:tetraacyldisaccharide 4'-kinase